MSISVWGFALSRGPWKVSDISSEQMSGQAFRTHQGQVGAFEMDLNVPLHMVPSNPQIYLSHYPVFLRHSEPYVWELIMHTNQAWGQVELC